MNKHLMALLGMLSVTSLIIPFTSQDNSSLGGQRKNKVNFFGTVTTRKNTTMEVENISIAGLFKQIPVYQKPAENEIDEAQKLFLFDPKNDIVTRIDLAETYEIQVPEPEKVWAYQKSKDSRKIEYIEIAVISNDSKKTKNMYVIETLKKILCDEINEAGPIEHEIPFQAITSLVFKGYKHRQEENGNSQPKTTTKTATRRTKGSLKANPSDGLKGSRVTA